MPLPRTLRSPVVGLEAIVTSSSPFSALDLAVETEAACEVRAPDGRVRSAGVATGAGFRGNRDSQWPFATEQDPGRAAR